MAFDFHKDKVTYIRHQKENAENYVIPFIEKVMNLGSETNVMEIGCAEGGVLKAFLNKGCKGTGVELVAGRYAMAESVLGDELKSGRARLINRDIYKVDNANEIPELFDLIILKDVIEHIHDQSKIIEKLRQFLKPGGCIFFGFPPWYMPYGGHQQIASNKVLSKLPYYHLLPRFLYKGLLKIGGESNQTIENLLEIKDTGISIERFERLIRQNNYSIQNKQAYLINPIYKYKFKLQPKKQFSVIANLPLLRNFLTTCMYYVVRKEE